MIQPVYYWPMIDQLVSRARYYTYCYYIIIIMYVVSYINDSRLIRIMPVKSNVERTQHSQTAFIYITLALLFSKREYMIITVQYARILLQYSVKPIIAYRVCIIYTRQWIIFTYVTAEFYRHFCIPVHISWNII